MPVLPGAEPYSADGGAVGVLVCHGFTGTPQSMRPWAEHLAGAGYAVRLPRLPGHGTTWQELNATRWQDWYAEVERAHAELAGRCEKVFAVGLSMGATLAGSPRRKATRSPASCSSIRLMAPSDSMPVSRSTSVGR